MSFTSLEQARKDSRFYRLLAFLYMVIGVASLIAAAAGCVVICIYTPTPQMMVGIAVLILSAIGSALVERFLRSTFNELQEFIRKVTEAEHAH